MIRQAAEWFVCEIGQCMHGRKICSRRKSETHLYFLPTMLYSQSSLLLAHPIGFCWPCFRPTLEFTTGKQATVWMTVLSNSRQMTTKAKILYPSEVPRKRWSACGERWSGKKKAWSRLLACSINRLLNKLECQISRLVETIDWNILQMFPLLKTIVDQRK